MDLLPFPADAPRRLLVGYSGGRDSSALLHRMAAWCEAEGRALRAVHVDHGLHPASEHWAAHCLATARRLGVSCAVHRVAVRREGRGLEDAARRARYAAFAAERRDDECLVLAHHRDDQAETLLLALLRGSGERGLSAMRPFTHDARGPIWRPLLETPASELAAYAEAHRLTWIDDPSNADERVDRNRLRHTVLPRLRRHWPQADAALARSAGHLAEADALLRQQAAKDLAIAQGLAGDTLDAAFLRALPPPRATRALRAWAEAKGIGLTRDAIERALVDWARHPRGRALQHPLGAHALRQWDGRLWLTAKARINDEGHGMGALAAHPMQTSMTAPWDGGSTLALPDGGTMALIGAAGFDAPLHLVARAGASKRFRTAGDAHSRSLQSVFVALGVPPWQRINVPLLADASGALQAVADLAYASELDGWLRARGARLLWQHGALRG